MADLKLRKPKEEIATPFNSNFLPSKVDENGVMVCCCGFELIRRDNDTWSCVGGARHTYRFSEGSIMKDKFGNILLKKDLPNGEKNGKKTN